MARPPGNKNLSKDVQEAIVRGRINRMTNKQPAQQFQVTVQAVGQVWKRYMINKQVVVAPHPGRPVSTTRNMDRNIVRSSREDPRRNSTDIFKAVNSPIEPAPSRRTIRRRLNAHGLFGRRPVKKPFISKKNQKARVAWAKAHLHWGRKEWAKHVWSDESKFNLFGSDGTKWVRRPIGTRYSPKYQVATVKHGGGNCMVWECFSETAMGPLRRVNGIMDRYQYEDILENTMRPWTLRNVGRAFVFQQDNDPKHTSLHVRSWFQRRRVDVLDWPSQSPDLNPIEHLWEELERHLAGVRASNADEKFAQLCLESYPIVRRPCASGLDATQMPSGHQRERLCYEVLNNF
uniref:Tc1-like transposase DDE domain-containing protein n=1 Tax=Caenorhabditis japonica TaxID=281687 RepID=A0A8R1E616_CAEJA